MRCALFDLSHLSRRITTSLPRKSACASPIDPNAEVRAFSREQVRLLSELARDQDMVPGLLNIGDANRPSSAWKYHAAHRVGCTGVDALGKLPGAGVEIDLTLDHVRGILGQGCFGHTRDRAKAKDGFVGPSELTVHRHRHAGDNHNTAGA